MRRWAFNILAGLSLLTALGLLWLWVHQCRAQPIVHLSQDLAVSISLYRDNDVFWLRIEAGGATHFVAFGAMGAILLACVLPAWRVWMPISRYLRRLYAEANGRCSVCNYDLTGNVSGVCPECGTPVPAR